MCDVCHSPPHGFSFQGDDKLSEAVSMLERSSQAGCLQSSYLLWEHKRRGAVSLLLHFVISNLGTWFLSVVKKI